jgi:hypothetical protein
MMDPDDLRWLAGASAGGAAAGLLTNSTAWAGGGFFRYRPPKGKAAAKKGATAARARKWVAVWQGWSSAGSLSHTTLCYMPGCLLCTFVAWSAHNCTPNDARHGACSPALILLSTRTPTT